MTPGLCRADLHVHTRHSLDAGMSPHEAVERGRAAGLDRMAVTDHGRVEGALRAHALDPELVVVGEEIRCAGRIELIGLFLSDWIPPGLSVEETADRIRSQGGVVYAPHPFAYLRRPTSRARRVLAVADVVEAANARAFWPAWNRRAGEGAAGRELPVGAGSDAHFGPEVGRAYTLLPEFGTADELRAALPEARPAMRKITSPVNHARSLGLKALRWVSERAAASPDPRPRPAWPSRSRQGRAVG